MVNKTFFRGSNTSIIFLTSNVFPKIRDQFPKIETKCSLSYLLQINDVWNTRECLVSKGGNLKDIAAITRDYKKLVSQHYSTPSGHMTSKRHDFIINVPSP